MRSGWMVFDDLEGQPETGSAEAVVLEALCAEEWLDELMFQGESLLALGWEGRPAPAHPVYTSLFQALRCMLQICC